MRYPVIIEKDGDCYMARFPDIPEALTGGDTHQETLNNAKDALVTAFEFYFEDQRPVPPPSTIEGDSVPVPPSVWAKVLLLNTMLEKNVSQVELAKLMGTRKQEVQRIVNLEHATKIDTLSHALEVLGKQLEISIA